ncbi:MAG TPA: TlpA disulfide reductase family protein [Thermoanaerobaculia bacterium]|nr:TlpA disulfide reductase family protein [Thermoanaerobaculia bacterium]
MAHRFLLLIVLAACTVAADAQDSVPFVAGLPDFPPLRNAMTSAPRTATLPVTSAGIFRVVTGQDAAGATAWRLYLKKPDGISELRALAMQEDAAGTLTTTVKLELDATSNASTLLELSVPRTGDVLLYRWVTGVTSTIALGQPLPEFALTARDGRTMRLTELKSPIMVLNTWATWCVACVEEMPSLNRLVKKYGRRGVEFVAIMEPKSSTDLTPFLKKHPFAYRQTLATDSSRRIFGDSYPRHVILGADGKVAYSSTGGSAHVDRELSAVLDKLLKK